MRTTLDSLIETLTNLRDNEGVDGNTEVLLAQQPNWPFEFTIGGVVAVELGEDEEYAEDVGKMVVYIAEGSSQEYLPGCVKDQLEAEGIW
jgi:hypothetical protein